MISMSLRGVRGGVGTSSTLAALGHALHELGQKVLLTAIWWRFSTATTCLPAPSCN